MKATSTNKFLWLIAIMITCAGTLRADVFDSTKKKEFNRTFAVGTSDRLKIENRYGSITVAYWSKSEITIRVEVTAKANSDSKAQEELDRVNVQLDKSGNTVSGVTSIRSSWSSNNSSIEVHYYVSMPQQLDKNIAQHYGRINLPENNGGKTSLEVRYGQITAGNFTDKITVDGQYSDISLGNMPTASFDLQYCQLKAKDAETLSLEGAYSPMKFENVKSVEAESSYGDLTLGNVNSITVKIRYASLAINRLANEFSSATFDYSNLKIQTIDAGFRKIDLSSAQYGNVNINIPSKAAFSVNVTGATYGNVNVKGFNITNSNISKSSHSYTINGGGNASVRVNSNGYTNVSVKEL
jgi:uncharacterized protein YjbI with pentapeptide repeats